MSTLVLRPAADEQLDLGLTLQWRHGGRGGEGGGIRLGRSVSPTNNDQTGAVSTNTPVFEAYNRDVMCLLYFALTQALPFKMEVLFTPPHTTCIYKQWHE